MKKDPPVHFHKNLPPWLCTSGSVEESTIQIERLTFFGWVWESYHSLRVTGASRDDKTGINRRIWGFGGDTTEMEISSFLIKKW